MSRNVHLDTQSAQARRFWKPVSFTEGSEDTSDMYLYDEFDTSIPTALHKASLRGNTKVLEHLLDVLKYRNIDTVDRNGDTALHICARAGNYGACEILCKVR